MARAFLADPAVLVLDEPTAALDPVSERRIVEGYENVMRGRTTIVITHRLDLARKADRIIVLDGARIVEQGPSARAARATGGGLPSSLRWSRSREGPERGSRRSPNSSGRWLHVRQFGKNHVGDKNKSLPAVHGFDAFLGNLHHLNAEEEP